MLKFVSSVREPVNKIDKNGSHENLKGNYQACEMTKNNHLRTVE